MVKVVWILTFLNLKFTKSSILTVDDFPHTEKLNYDQKKSIEHHVIVNSIPMDHIEEIGNTSPFQLQRTASIVVHRGARWSKMAKVPA